MSMYVNHNMFTGWSLSKVLFLDEFDIRILCNEINYRCRAQREKERGGGIYNHFKTKLEEKMYAFVPAFKHIIGLR